MASEALPLIVSVLANATTAAFVGLAGGGGGGGGGAADASSTAALAPLLPAAPPALAALHPAAAAAALPGGLGVGLSTSGFLGFFFLGALAALERLGIFSPATSPIAGASGGALVGFSTCLGVPTETAMSIAHDLTALCRGRGSCAGFLDAPVRRMLNATVAAALANAGALPAEALTSADGFGGYGAGGNFSRSGSGARGGSLRASGSPDFWAAADALVAERCAGRLHVMASELVRPGVAPAPRRRRGLLASDDGGGGGEGGGGNGSSSTAPPAAGALMADPLSGRGAVAAAARAADDAIAADRAGRPVAPPANAETGRIIAAALGLGGVGVVGGGASSSSSSSFAPLVATAASPSASANNSSTAPSASRAAAPIPSAPAHPFWRPFVLTDFLGGADAAEGAAASAFIPIFSGPSITTSVRNAPAADGMLVQALPCPPGVAYCVRISAALPDSALVQGTQAILKPDIAPGLRVPLSQTVRQWQARALSAPSRPTSQALLWLGEREAEAWAVEVGLASAERVAELRSAAAAAVVLTEERGQAAAVTNGTTTMTNGTTAMTNGTTAMTNGTAH